MENMQSYWDEVIVENVQNSSFLWRDYSNIINEYLIKKWFSNKVRNVLKTDLFDEAINKGLYPLLALYSNQVIGVDISPLAVDMASNNYSALNAQLGDVRDLPFANNSFEFIVSNSTIDHFANTNDILQSLNEFYRVLSKNGNMFISMDNLANPLIYIRNLMHKTNRKISKIAPYYVGETLTPWSFKRHLQNTGFVIDEFNICMNFPRIFLVVFEKHLEKIFSRSAILKFCKKFEILSQTPLCYFTGYFIAAKVRKA